MLRPYREVLSRPGALAFSLTALLARLPISTVGIGLVLLVSSVYDSYALAGRVTAAYVIATAVGAPLLSRLVDQHGQARVMRPALAVSATGLTSLTVAATQHAPELLLLVLAATTGATVGSVGALVRARWSALLDNPTQVHTAYALESTFDEVVFVSGPVVVTLLATSITPWVGLTLPIVAMVVGGYLFLAQRGTEPRPSGQRPKGVGGSALRHPGTWVLIVTFACMGSLFGATDVAVVAFTEEQGRAGLAGALLAIFALGSLVAGLGYGARQWSSPASTRFVVGMAGLAGGVSLFLLVDHVLTLAPVMFVAGFAIAPTLITGNGLVASFGSPARLTEGLTWVSTALNAGLAVGASVAGEQIDRNGAEAGFVVIAVSGGIGLLVSLIGIPALRRPAADANRTPDAAEPFTEHP